LEKVKRKVVSSEMSRDPLKVNFVIDTQSQFFVGITILKRAVLDHKGRADSNDILEKSTGFGHKILNRDLIFAFSDAKFTIIKVKAVNLL